MARNGQGRKLLAFEVVEFKTGAVVKTVEVGEGKSPGQIDKVEMGLLRQLDLERFHLREKYAPDMRGKHKRPARG